MARPKKPTSPRVKALAKALGAGAVLAPKLELPSDLQKVVALPYKPKPGKPTQAQYLKIGERFEVIGLKDNFKSLYVVSVTTAAVTIRGDVLKGTAFSPVGNNYCIACTTRVRPL